MEQELNESELILKQFFCERVWTCVFTGPQFQHPAVFIYSITNMPVLFSNIGQINFINKFRPYLIFKWP